MSRITTITLLSAYLIVFVQWQTYTADAPPPPLPRRAQKRRPRTASNISMSMLAREVTRRASTAHSTVETGKAETDELSTPPPSLPPSSAPSTGEDVPEIAIQPPPIHTALQHQEKRLRCLLKCSCVQTSMLIALLVQSSFLYENVSHITADVVSTLDTSIDTLQMNLETIVPDINETLDTQLDAALLNMTHILALTMQLKDKFDFLEFHFSDLNTTFGSVVSNLQAIPQTLADNFAIINKQLFDTQDALGQINPTMHTMLQQLENFDETFDILSSFEHRFERIENDLSTALLTITQLGGQLNQLDSTLTPLSGDFGFLRNDHANILMTIDHSSHAHNTSLLSLIHDVQELPERIGNVSSILHDIHDRFDTLELGLGLFGKKNDQNKPTSDSSLYVIDPQSPTPSTQDRGCPEAHASLEKLLKSLYDCYDTSYGDYSPIPEAESNIVALLPSCPQAMLHFEQVSWHTDQCLRSASP